MASVDENVKPSVSFASGLEVPNGSSGLNGRHRPNGHTRSDSGIGESIGSLNSEGSFNGDHNSQTPSPIPSPSLNKSHRIRSFGPHQTEASGPQSKAHAKIKTYSDDPDVKKFPRISRPVELLRSWNEYDCVVIGSGYGGGVAASRMARAGQSVCLLERGQERWPGEYPSGFLDAVEQMHVSGKLRSRGSERCNG